MGIDRRTNVKRRLSWTTLLKFSTSVEKMFKGGQRDEKNTIRDQNLHQPLIGWGTRTTHTHVTWLKARSRIFYRAILHFDTSLVPCGRLSACCRIVLRSGWTEILLWFLKHGFDHKYWRGAFQCRWLTSLSTHGERCSSAKALLV